MIRSNRLALPALIVALSLCASDALAARALLNELLTRAPAAVGQPIMSSLALEACLRRAEQLDRTGIAVDIEVAAVDRLAAEGIFLQNQINAEIPMVGDYDEKRLNEFQRRVIRHEELARKFKTDFLAYQTSQQDYNAAVAGFERDCSNGFSTDNLNAARARLGIK